MWISSLMLFSFSFADKTRRPKSAHRAWMSQLPLERHRPLPSPDKILCMDEVGKSLSEVTVWCLRAVPQVIVLQTRAQTAYNGPADIAVKDIVNHRVDTAVGEGQGPTYLHGQLERCHGKLVFWLQPWDNGQELESIKGQPGEDEGWCHNNDDLYGLPQLFVMLSWLLVMSTQPPRDATVAGQNAQQGDEKGDN